MRKLFILLFPLLLSCSGSAIQLIETVVTNIGVALIKDKVPDAVTDAINKSPDKALAIKEWAAVKASVDKDLIPLLKGVGINFKSLTDWSKLLLDSLKSIPGILKPIIETCISFIELSLPSVSIDYLKTIPDTQPFPKAIQSIFLAGMQALSDSIGQALEGYGTPTIQAAKLMNYEVRWRP